MLSSKLFFSRKSSQGGYALAITVVFVAVAVTIAGGLAVNRQMWGHMGEKQLHRILTQTALDVDSLAMMTELRQSLEGADQDLSFLSVNSNLGAFGSRTTLSISPLSSDPDSSSVVYSSTVQVAIPSSHSEAGSFPLGSNLFYDQLDTVAEPSFLGMWDPYREIWSKTVAFGVLTKNELEGGARVNKDIRPVRNDLGAWQSGSRLHAWTEVDTAKLHEIVVRRLPATAFTLFVPTAGIWETLGLGWWVNGGSSSQPLGRYYTETCFVPGRANLHLNLPLVAAGGVDWGAWQWDEMQPSMKLSISDIASNVNEDGSPKRNLRYVYNVLDTASPDELYKHRYTTYGGMIATGMDRPVVFRRFGGHSASLEGVRSGQLFPLHTSGGGWFPPAYGSSAFNSSVIPVSQEKNILAQLWARADVRIVRDDPEDPSGVLAVTNTLNGYPTSVATYLKSEAITVNHAAQEIVLDFSQAKAEGFLGVSELLLHVSSGGLDEMGEPLTQAQIDAYMVRIILPHADDLGFTSAAFQPSGSGGLTIVTPHPVIFEGGFNDNGSSVPVMVVAQNFVADVPPGYPAEWHGVFLTSGLALDLDGSPFNGFAQGYPGRVPSAVSVHGSVIFWERGDKPLITLGGGAWTSVPVNLYPSSVYLSGLSYPPGTPALLDLRFGRERLQTYRMYSEDTVLTPTPGDDDEEM